LVNEEQSVYTDDYDDGFNKFFEDIKKNPQYDSEVIKKAYDLARDAHKNQRRRSGEPYIMHPVAVAEILYKLGMDNECIVGALLHDVVEDTQYDLDYIRKEFGDEVALLVDGVTKLGQIPLSTREEVQAENIRKMFIAMNEDVRVIIIKLCDRLHNMRTLQHMPPYKQREKSLETLEIYAPIAHRLGIRPIKEELEDLAIYYLDPIAYKEIEKNLSMKKEQGEKFLADITKQISDKITPVMKHVQITSRVKSVHGIFRKVYIKGKDFEQIFDIYAVRIIVDTMIDCYNALGIVHDMFKPLPGRFKDYISMPKPNMYQSLHTTVLSDKGVPFEIQIRTWDMHRTAEYGIAAHWKYKLGRGGKDSIDSRLEWIHRMIEHGDETDTPEELVTTIKGDLSSDEVYVFTPRGDVKALPKGATVIDFAYAIHSAVGNKMVGAKVNGRIVPLDYKLSNGDIVEVITSKQAAGPSRDWLNIVGSSDSRNKIKSWFKKERREENIIKGREMLEKECKRLGYDTKILLKSDKLKDVSAQLRLENEENLMATIGYGGITLNSVMSKLVELYKKEQKLTTTKDLSQLLAELKPRRSKAKSSHGILVKGEEGIMVKLARCCNPIPGDPVIGYITRGSGISVHRRDCPNVMSNNPEEQNRLIEVAWDIATDSLYKVNIIISAGDRPGMMADIMMVMSESKLNINALNCRIDKHKMANISMGIDISNLEQLDNIMNKIKRMKGVYSVERMISNGQGG